MTPSFDPWSNNARGEQQRCEMEWILGNAEGASFVCVDLMNTVEFYFKDGRGVYVSLRRESWHDFL